MVNHSSIFPGFLGKTNGQRSLLGYSPWGGKRVGHRSVTEQQVFMQQHYHQLIGSTSNPCGHLGLWYYDSVVKNLPVNAGDVGSIPVLGRLPGEENGNPLQHSHLENPMDRGAWWTMVHRVAKQSDMTQRLKNNKLCIMGHFKQVPQVKNRKENLIIQT